MTAVIKPAPTQVAADPVALKRLGNAFCEAKLLMTATELGLFTVLDGKPATEAELRVRLGLGIRGTGDFLDALVALGLLERTGNLYSNGAAAAEFLVRGKDEYSGGFLERANRMLYPAWGSLTDALRTGAPQTPASLHAVQADPERVNSYLAMMDSVNSLLVPDILELFPWADCASAADIGGARGNVLGMIAQQHPGLRGTVFDRPSVAEPARAHLDKLGVADRVRFTDGDFFAEDLPTADVLMMGHVLHNWAPQQRKELIAKCYAALEPGGALLIYDAMLDDDAPELSKLLVSLNMLLVTEGGSEYPVQECLGYLTEAGFSEMTAHGIGADNTLVIARK